MRRKLPKLFFVLSMCVTLMACDATTPVRMKEAFNRNFAFVENGKTRMEDVLLRVGAPDGEYDQRRIFIYRIPWNSPEQAILRFDDAGTLKQHVFVEGTASQELSVLENGSSRRPDIIMRLGMPSGVYAGGENLTYLLPLVRTKNSWIKKAGDEWPSHLLVLEFGPDGVLRDHRIVDRKEMKK